MNNTLKLLEPIVGKNRLTQFEAIQNVSADTIHDAAAALASLQSAIGKLVDDFQREGAIQSPEGPVEGSDALRVILELDGMLRSNQEKLIKASHRIFLGPTQALTQTVAKLAEAQLANEMAAQARAEVRRTGIRDSIELPAVVDEPEG